jgi:UDPglucose 6-dehydrogenase
LLQPPAQWLPMGLRAAEFSRYACHAALAARLSLMNDFATLAEALQVDIGDVQRALAADARIGPHFLEPGCGFGAASLQKDLRSMRRSATEAGVQLPMLDAAELVNERQKTLLPWHIIRAFDGHLAGRRIALWGLSFRPGTDDLRDAPSEAVIQALLAEGAEVVAYDPQAMPAARARYAELPRLRFAADPFGAVVGADALAIVTDWPEFHQIDWRKVRRCMEGLRVFDGRNVCPVDELVELGFSYRGVGRAVHEAPAEVAVHR